MANVVKLINGGTIQVRSGVLAGIGPVGPGGPPGPQGNQGLQGPQGDTGPIGQITQVQARAVMSGAVALPQTTNTPIAFPGVNYDDMAVFTSATQFTVLSNGDYMISAWVSFTGSNSGERTLRVYSTTNNVLWNAARPAAAAGETIVSISAPVRAVAGEVFQIYGHSDAANVSAANGALTFVRMGSGPPGPAGPQGIQGNNGPQGIQGVKGDPGNSSAGFATYGAIDGG